mgnify:CR=1 FL=1
MAGRKRFPVVAFSLAAALCVGLSDVGAPNPAFAQAKKERVPTPSAKPKKGQATEQPRQAVPANIDRNGVLILVKSALIALDQANRTGNYTVLRDLGSPSFQANTAAKLGDIFAPQRERGVDLGGVIVLDPQLTLLPQIEPNGMLHIAGFFPSVPTQVYFEALWEPVDREWRLFGLSVNLANGGPRAPQSDALPPEPQQPAEPPQAPSGAVSVTPQEEGAP